MHQMHGRPPHCRASFIPRFILGEKVPKVIGSLQRVPVIRMDASQPDQVCACVWSSAKFRHGECLAYLPREAIGDLRVAWYRFDCTGVGIGPEGVGRSLARSPYGHRHLLRIVGEAAECVLSAVTKNQLNRCGQTRTRFLPRVALAVSPWHFRTVRDVPIVIPL